MFSFGLWKHALLHALEANKPLKLFPIDLSEATIEAIEAIYLYELESETRITADHFTNSTDPSELIKTAYRKRVFNSTFVIFFFWGFALLVQQLRDTPFTFRTLVSKNKKRYLDLYQEIDLDLTYITNRLIAMGVPVQFSLSKSGFEALFRNPIGEVRRFLDSAEGPNTRYRIFNVCPEMPYPTEIFHYRVESLDVQDHSPPSFPVLVEFLTSASHWSKADPRNVIVIHCKAGKGRTGTLCCAWLLYSRMANSAAEALEMFADRRTDHMKRSAKKKKIAVDTWGQVRQVYNLDLWLRTVGVDLSSNRELTPPPEVPAILESVTMSDIVHVDGGQCELICEILNPAWYNGPGTVVGNAIATTEGDVTTFMFPTGVRVKGDFRINIFLRHKYEQWKRESKSKKSRNKRYKAGKEPGLAFYIFQHTAFLEPSGSLDLKKHELGDSKKMKKFEFKDNGCIQLRYRHDASSLSAVDREYFNRLQEQLIAQVSELRDHANTLNGEEGLACLEL